MVTKANTAARRGRKTEKGSAKKYRFKFPKLK